MEIDWKKKYEEALERARIILCYLGYGDRSISDLETVFPELRESEGEKIREEIVSFIRAFWVDHRDSVPQTSKWLDWLEKQKEPTEELSTRLNGLMQEYVKSGKDEEEQEHRLKCYQLFWDALGDSEFFKQKKQKPPITGNDFGWIDELEHDLEYPEELDQKVDDVLKQRKGIRALEWSEEDEKMVETICKEGDLKPSEKRWLKSLPERFNLQPQQEWSKEDTERYLSCLQRLGTGNSDQPETINSKWFKEHCYPQPKPEWSDEDEAIYDSIIREIVDKDMAMTNLQKRWLRSLKNRGSNTNSPSWKPSDEQMGLFGRIVNDLKIKMVGVTIKEHHTLESLYDDLKKLM